LQDLVLVAQPAHAGVELSELAVKRCIVQSLHHGWIAQAEALLHEVDAQHRLHGKVLTTCLARRRMRLHQGHQFRPRHHQAHLVEKFTLASALDGQLESSGGKALSSHPHLRFKHDEETSYGDFP
jgi:hypothetical protein